MILPPEGYLKRLREICDQYEVFLIADEIQTGMGRTGTLWACEHYDVVPDILIYGKSFGGGVMPITGIVARPHLWCDKVKDNPWIPGSPTFGGNTLACSAYSDGATAQRRRRNDAEQRARRRVIGVSLVSSA